jgi:hypothetical protein
MSGFRAGRARIAILVITGMDTAARTLNDLPERLGHLHDLGELAAFCHVQPDQLGAVLRDADVPIITVADKTLVPAELAEDALGLAGIEVVLELRRNRAWMDAQWRRLDGTLKSDAEFVANVDQLGEALLDEARGDR